MLCVVNIIVAFIYFSNLQARMMETVAGRQLEIGNLTGLFIGATAIVVTAFVHVYRLTNFR